ncbi:MAG: Slp family lipoprotein [Pseudomonadota bacterium]
MLQARSLTGTMVLAATLLSACTSPIPPLIRQGPADSPWPAVVRGEIDTYRDQQVRWGGSIIATENRKDATRLTVLGRLLYRDGEPRLTDDNAGRFIVRVPEFLDPKVYAPDRRITVTGTVRGTESGKVGEHTYVYPVVEAQAWYLWPQETDRYHYYDDPWYDPWWYDRWYSPWYYRGYPYAYPYRYWR